MINQVALKAQIEPCEYETIYEEKNLQADFPLHEATQQGDFKAVKELACSNPHLLSSLNKIGKAPIHIAASQNKKDMTKLLLELGTKVNLRDDQSNTALHIASSHGYLDLVRFLVEQQAKVSAINSTEQTPLHLAVNWNHYAISKLLLENGASVDVCSHWSYFSPSGTPLHLAVAANNAPLTNLLLEYNANPNQRNGWGETPLHIAAYYRASKQIIESLIQANAMLNKKNGANRWTAKGTPLHVAADKNALPALEALLDAKANINSTNSLKQTPLMAAILAGNVGCVDALLEHGAQLDIEDEDGNTAFDLAQRNQDLPNGKAVLSLLEKAAQSTPS